MLCKFAISNVLTGTEQLVGAPRGVSFHRSQDLNKSYFAVRTNDAMVRLQVGSATNRLLDYAGGICPILWMDHLENGRHVNGALHRVKPPDATKLGGPSDLIVGRVELVMSYVSNSLSFFEPGITLP